MVLNVLDLPFDILHQILNLLSHLDLAKCQLVNSQLDQIIRNSLHLQYNIALALSKSEDNPCSVASIAEKLQDIKSSEESWFSFQPKFILSLPVKHSTSGIYDLSGGTYLLGNADKKILQYLKLPTKSDDSLDWYKVRVDLDKTVIDMGFCVFEHDLIAIVTTSPRPVGVSMREEHDIEMFLFEYSSGKPHPRAKSHRVFVMTSDFARPSLMCEIVGNNLVLILNFPGQADRIFVWDWFENVLKMTFSAAFQTYSGLLFLSEDLILLPNSLSATFDIFRIPPIPIAYSPNPIFSLNIPTLAERAEIDRITCRAEPNPIPDMSRLQKKRRARDRAAAGMDETDPFAPKRGFLANAEDAICIFQMHFTGDPVVVIQGGLNVHFEMGRSYTLFIHRSSFLNLVHKYERSPPPDDVVAQGVEQNSVLRVPWVDWGPPVSRWFNADRSPTRWITTSAGQRCAVIYDDAGSQESPIYIVDFNPYNIRKLKAKIQNGVAKHRKQVALTTPDEGISIFSHDSDPVDADPESEMDVDPPPYDDMHINDEADLHSFVYDPLVSNGELDDMFWIENDESLDEACLTKSSHPRHPGRVRYLVSDSQGALNAVETFAEEVEGHLPYAVYASERRYHYDGVLLDEERIIGVKTDVTDRISEVEIMYFG